MKIHKDSNKSEQKDSSELFKIFSRSVGSIHDVFLSDEIHDDSLEYVELIRFLEESKEEDYIQIHLANFGGACHSGLRICHAIKACRAAVIIKVEAPCYSMGAIIALAGDAVVMCPGVYLMFHNYSSTRSGKGSEIKASVQEYEKHFKKSLKYFCYPFLSLKELNKIGRDEDVYIHDDDPNIAARLARHFKNADFSS